MEKEITVGQSCEVVKILTDGGYFNSFKTNSFTIGHKGDLGIYCLPNHDYTDAFKYRYMSLLENEVKPIGKLTVTKVK